MALKNCRIVGWQKHSLDIHSLVPKNVEFAISECDPDKRDTFSESVLGNRSYSPVSCYNLHQVFLLGVIIVEESGYESWQKSKVKTMVLQLMLGTP